MGENGQIELLTVWYAICHYQGMSLKKSRTILLAFTFLNLLSAHAQQTARFIENPAYKPALGGLIGTTGIGLAFYHPLGVQFGLEVGAGLHALQYAGRGHLWRLPNAVGCQGKAA